MKIDTKIRLQASLTRLPAPIFPPSELLLKIYEMDGVRAMTCEYLLVDGYTLYLPGPS